MLNKQTLNKNCDQLISSFKEVCEQLSWYFGKYGLVVLPYLDGCPHFNIATATDKKNFLERASLYLQTLGHAEERKIDLLNNADSLWATLVFLKLRPPSDFFSYLSDDDKIEVYDLNGVQIWRNINVMAVCSYSFEEMLCLPWDERYCREESMTQKIYASVGKVISSSESQVYYEQIPSHIVKEKKSQKKYTLLARHDYFAPLFDVDNKVAGFVVTSKVDVLGEEGRRIDHSPWRPSLI